LTGSVDDTWACATPGWKFIDANQMYGKESFSKEVARNKRIGMFLSFQEAHEKSGLHLKISFLTSNISSKPSMPYRKKTNL